MYREINSESEGDKKAGMSPLSPQCCEALYPLRRHVSACSSELLLSLSLPPSPQLCQMGHTIAGRGRVNAHGGSSVCQRLAYSGWVNQITDKRWLALVSTSSQVFFFFFFSPKVLFWCTSVKGEAQLSTIWQIGSYTGNIFLHNYTLFINSTPIFLLWQLHTLFNLKYTVW